MRELIAGGASLSALSGAEDMRRMPIHTAAWAGQLEAVRFIIGLNTQFATVQDSQTDLPIHLAAQAGNVDIVDYFITQLKMSVETRQSRNGWTPMHSACLLGQLQMVKYLAKKGASMTAKAGTAMNGHLPIHTAAMYGRTFIVRHFIERVDPNMAWNLKDDAGQVALHWTAFLSQTHIADYLLSLPNAAVDARSTSGRTPLLIAAQQGRIDMVQYYARKGANVAAQDTGGNNGLHLATQSSQVELARYFVKNGVSPRTKNTQDLSSVEMAVIWNLMPMLRYFLEEVDATLVNVSSSFGDLLIHRAVRQNQTDVVNYLLQTAKVNVNSQNVNLGRTPLHTAAESDNAFMASLLMRNGANTSALSGANDGLMTPVNLAANFGSFNFIRTVLESGPASLATAYDGQGRQPIHIAVQQQRTAVIDYLRTRTGVSIDAPLRADGRTSLHIYAMRQSLDMVKMLVETYGANLKARDNAPWGSMPIHLAAELGTLPIVQYLVGRDRTLLTEKNLYGNTPADRARIGGKTDILNWLQSQSSTG